MISPNMVAAALGQSLPTTVAFPTPDGAILVLDSKGGLTEVPLSLAESILQEWGWSQTNPELEEEALLRPLSF